jgi:hypothetical protein
MNTRQISLTAVAVALCGVILYQTGCAPVQKEEVSAPAMTSVERGKYLVNIGGCNDCHTPKIMTDKGPVPDESLTLSGLRQGTVLPEIDWSLVDAGKFVLMGQDLGYFIGPWGVSFAYNLTPDTATGIGAWNFELFQKIVKTGMHMGMENGRPVLPPMVVQGLQGLTDEDLRAIFDYLKSLPPIHNRIPDPLPPPVKS